MVKKAIYVYLKAKAGKEAELEKFLTGALPLVNAEPLTTTWYAIKMGPGQFGIFDTFADDTGRDAHLNGKVAAALMANAATLLENTPNIDKVDVLAAKVPG